MSQHYCNNCGKQGHSFHQCKVPITSFGVIVFRKTPADDIEYLMIRRKDTLGFIDFMRGKYSVYNKDYILNMMRQMTVDEKARLKTHSFDQIWLDIWGSGNVSEQYRNEEAASRDKFGLLKHGVYTKTDSYTLNDLVDMSESFEQWTEAEWGFPKGRRNYQERDYDCAVREFSEETGYSAASLVNIKNILPFEEIFTGSNYKSYKHKYYLNMMCYEDSLAPRNIQTCEVSASEWKTYEECLAAIRPYNQEKRIVLESIHRMLRENTLV
jgi:8-oxo-dGTP pyrophosphatase MutT (NUDIX family)